MAHMGVNYHNQYLSLSFYYSDETEEMAVDDIPEDILDQEDTELSPLLSQPIVPVPIIHLPTQPCQPLMSAFELQTSTVQSLPSALHKIPTAMRFNTFISLATDMCTLDNNNDYYNVYYIKP